MTWQRSPGAGAEPRNSTGSPASSLPPAVLSGGTDPPGVKGLVGTGVVLLLPFVVALKFMIIKKKDESRDAGDGDPQLGKAELRGEQGGMGIGGGYGGIKAGKAAGEGQAGHGTLMAGTGLLEAAW